MSNTAHKTVTVSLSETQAQLLEAVANALEEPQEKCLLALFIQGAIATNRFRYLSESEEPLAKADLADVEEFIYPALHEAENGLIPDLARPWLTGEDDGGTPEETTVMEGKAQKPVEAAA